MIYKAVFMDKGNIKTATTDDLDNESQAMIEIESFLSSNPGVWLVELKEVKRNQK